MDNLTLATHDYKINLWIDRIKECKSSNMTVTAWCEENDINVKTYYYWMRKIKREAFEKLPAECKARQPIVAPPAGPSFAEIPIAPMMTAGAAVVIKINGISIEIQDGASRNTIENTLQAVRELC